MKTVVFFIFLLITGNLSAQTASSFLRLGSQEETVQDLFPGSHNARPVMADFTNNGYLDLFYGGQDVGGAAQYFYEEEVNSDNRWGDQGNGNYVNPVLNADYSDPDVIRVGNKYYMICSEFHYMGMPVLESEDMLNWKMIGQVYDRLNFPKYDTNERYGGGSWAPALRYHDGKFWIFFCTPDEGLFMSTATEAAGPWAPLTHVKNVGGWEDPCPFWDEDGQAYLGRSQLGAGPIFLHKMKNDGTALLDDGVKVYEGPVAEGTKIYKKDGYYYFSIPEGGVSTGWQTILRSENIYGPYEVKKVLEQGSTDINGPHQGALVDTPEGEWWFYHFQSKDPLGRVVHLQPVRWENGWPVIGVDTDGNGVGEPIKEWAIPNTGYNGAVFAPQASDDFASSERGLQWQINHNPVDTQWSLDERPGYLRLKALKAAKLRDSKNMFTQKAIGYEGEAVTEVDGSQLADGQRAGIFCVGNQYNAAGIEKKGGKYYIYFENDGNAEQVTDAFSTVYFKVALNANTNRNRFYYSFDNEAFLPCGEAFTIRSGDWKGMRIGLFSYHTEADGGIADFNNFDYRFDGAGGVTLPHNSDLDQHGNPNWNTWNELAALVKNNGDGTFTVVSEKQTNMAFSKNSNAVFFDYDNDCNLDLLLVGQVGWWPRGGEDRKFACLYRNLGEESGYRFQEVQNTGLRQYNDEENKYFNLISVGDYDHDGYNDLLIMNKDESSRRVDLYRNDAGSGFFDIQSGNFAAASNGAVMFGDLDNDGWLDIMYTGDNNWGSIRTYKNKQNSTFEDITAENLEGSMDSQSALADVNGDGALDIMVTGHIQNWGRISTLYYNTINPQTGKPEYRPSVSAETNISAVNKANVLIADFNNDGRMDMVMNGEKGDGESRNRIYYQKTDGSFLLDASYPLSSTRDGGINMGDLNGDGNMDIIIAGYKASGAANPSYDSPVRVYENRPADAGLSANTPPTAPASVRAVYESGKLIITWEPATDDLSASKALRYNIYVKNNSTGKCWMMIPADTLSGRVKVGTDLQTSLSAAVNEYSLSLPPDNYTIGVQALDQAYAGGPFATFNETFTGIAAVSRPVRSIYLLENGIRIKSDRFEAVEILNVNGQKIMQGQTNTNISLSKHGFYIAKIENDCIKFVR